MGSTCESTVWTCGDCGSKIKKVEWCTACDGEQITIPRERLQKIIWDAFDYGHDWINNEEYTGAIAYSDRILTELDKEAGNI